MLVGTGAGGGGAGRGGGGVTQAHSTVDSASAAKIAIPGIVPFELFINRLHYQGVRTLNARDPIPVDANPNDPEGPDRLRPYPCYDRLAAPAVPGSRGIRHTLDSAVFSIQSSRCRAKIESRNGVVMS